MILSVLLLILGCFWVFTKGGNTGRTVLRIVICFKETGDHFSFHSQEWGGQGDERGMKAEAKQGRERSG